MSATRTAGKGGLARIEAQAEFAARFLLILAQTGNDGHRVTLEFLDKGGWIVAGHTTKQGVDDTSVLLEHPIPLLWITSQEIVTKLVE